MTLAIDHVICGNGAFMIRTKKLTKGEMCYTKIFRVAQGTRTSYGGHVATPSFKFKVHLTRSRFLKNMWHKAGILRASTHDTHGEGT